MIRIMIFESTGEISAVHERTLEPYTIQLHIRLWPSVGTDGMFIVQIVVGKACLKNQVIKPKL